MESILGHMTARLACLLLASVVAFDGIEIGDQVPPLKLKTVEGKTFNAKRGLDGKAGIVVFWRLGQEHSDRLLKDLQEIYDESASDGLKIVAICAGEADPGAVLAVSERLGLKFPVLLDPDRHYYGQFGVIVTPATGFVDGSGKLRFYYASHRRDFPQVASANVDFLLGKIPEEKRADRVKSKKAPSAAEANNGGMKYRMGLKSLARGDLEMAKTMFRKAWEAEKPFTEAGMELGLLLLKEGEDKEALEVLGDVAERRPDDARALGAKGLALIRNGETEEGLKLAEEALEKGVGDPLLFYEMGLWYEERGDTKRAIDYLKQGLEAAMKLPAKR